MCNDRLNEDFIRRANELCKELGIKYAKENWYKNNHLPSVKKARTKYEKSEKGKIASKKRSSIRSDRLNATNLPKWHKKMIQDFYLERPDGYEVDHIIPLSKGGKHEMSNLQWLKISENRKKSASIILKQCNFPHCLL